MAIFSAANVNGVCSWTSNSFETVTDVTQGAYTLYADKSMAIHDHNFDLYAKDYVPSWGTLPHTFDSGYESWGTWEQNGLVQLGSPFNMKLPLPGGKNWKLNTQIGGSIECNGGTDQFHTGSNFYSLDFGHYSQENGDESDIPILAVAPGEVNQDLTGWSSSYGNTVVIDHFGGYRTRYAHMASPSLVTSGHVNQGDQLGVMGTTPGGIYSTGIHLHLQVYYNGSSTQSVPELANVTMENKSLSNYVVGCHSYYYSGNYPLP